ncbi:hypothetical protein [Rhodococcoides fascians]|uniref:hypothetical protein n=1 Tax=Rhodococcoides fascians TaxID=1828 RepID=UPI00055A6225|nr:hypothetical protein [Rhodococcus fascians]
MRRRTQDTALSVDGNRTVDAAFPAFVVEDWLGRVEPGKPLDGPHAFHAYSRARLQWCRDHGIDSYDHIHGPR